eukprot:gene9922-11750_t
MAQEFVQAAYGANRISWKEGGIDFDRFTDVPQVDVEGQWYRTLEDEPFLPQSLCLEQGSSPMQGCFKARIVCVTAGTNGTAPPGTPCVFYEGFSECADHGGEHGAHGYCLTSRGYYALWGSCDPICDELRSPEGSSAMTNGTVINGSVASIGCIEGYSAHDAFSDLSVVIVHYVDVAVVVLCTDVVLGGPLPAINRSLVITARCGSDAAEMCTLDGRGRFRILELQAGGWELYLERLELRSGGVLNGDGAALMLGEGSAAILSECALSANAARSALCSDSCAFEYDDYCDDGEFGSWPGSTEFCGWEADPDSCEAKWATLSELSNEESTSYCPLGTDCKDCGVRHLEGGRGGAVYMHRNASLAVIRSLVANNEARLAGGGIYTEAGASVILDDSDVSNNHAAMAPPCLDDAEYTWSYANASYDCGGTLTALWYDLLIGVSNGMAPRGCGEMAAAAEEVGIADAFSPEDQAELIERCPVTCGVCPAMFGCSDTCYWAENGSCDDNGPGTTTSGTVFRFCELGTDCADCGQRYGFGGGLHLEEDAVLTVLSSAVRGNTVSGHGGGVAVNDRAVVRVQNSSYVGENSAEQSGAGVCLFGEGARMVLESDSAVISNNAMQDGGGMFLGDHGVLDVHHAVVRNNSALSSNTLRGGGGGVWLGVHATATIAMSVVEANSALSASGGGLMAGDSTRVVMTGSRVVDNRAVYGAGLSSINGTSLLIRSSRIIRCAAEQSGGGIYLDGPAPMLLEGALLEGNTAGSDGGALVAGQGSVVELTEASQLSHNVAGRNGAGIFALSAEVAIRNGSKVASGSVGASGGGLYMEGQCALTLAGGSSVTGNAADGSGGGIYIQAFSAGASLDIEQSLVGNNSAQVSGGGVWAGAETVVRVVSGRIEQNRAEGSCGGFEVEHTIELRDSRVEKNVAGGEGGGGCSSTDSAMAVLVSTVVASNVAAADGGGLYSYGSLRLEDSSVSTNIATYGNGGGVQGVGPSLVQRTAVLANTAEGAGGGIHSKCLKNNCGALTLEQGSSVEGNVAGESGGGVDGVHIRIDGESTVRKNHAVSGGGGIAVGKGGGLVVQGASMLDANTAGREGGGLLCADKTSIEVKDHSSVSFNTAATWGGGISVSTSQLTISNRTRLQANEAARFGDFEGRGTDTVAACAMSMAMAAVKINGGAVSVSGSSLYMVEATFVTNYARTSGGAIYLESESQLTLLESVLANNTGNVSGGGIHAADSNMYIGLEDPAYHAPGSKRRALAGIEPPGRTQPPGVASRRRLADDAGAQPPTHPQEVEAEVSDVGGAAEVSDVGGAAEEYNVLIEGNSASTGAALAIEGTSVATVVGARVARNVAEVHACKAVVAALLLMSGARVRMTASLLEANLGSGLALEGGSAGEVVNSTIRLHVSEYGAGLHIMAGAAARVLRCVVEGNEAMEGGGVWSGGNLTVESSVMYGNSAGEEGSESGSGGAVYLNLLGNSTFTQ